jgi:two-component system, chemotaxis family, chemotaxis protein CheY
MKKIVLVEDDEVMARMYRKVFSFGGFEITVASDGREGLKKIKQILPDLIILDVMMPKMNGLEVLNELKLNRDTKNIPVVMLTNLSLPEEIRFALEKGAVRYLIKCENEPKKVFEIVQKLLDD